MIVFTSTYNCTKNLEYALGRLGLILEIALNHCVYWVLAEVSKNL